MGAETPVTWISSTRGEPSTIDTTTSPPRVALPRDYNAAVEIVDELPKTATGKIQRYKLR
jgi:acyl-CoA synthetase (AMP-forming)/AMP-acid ligase II